MWIRMGDIMYRLLFTRDDDLDLLQILFTFCILYFFFAFAFAGQGTWEVSTAAWATFGTVFATLAIAGSPKWVAGLLATSKTPGEVAAGIAEAGGSGFGEELMYRRIDNPDV